MTEALHDGAAEMAVIGALMVSKRAVSEVSEILVPEDFYSERNRDIFRAALELQARGEEVDPITTLRQLGGAKNKTVADYITHIMDSIPTASNAPQHARIVRDYAIRRQFVEAGELVIQRAHEDPDAYAVADYAEQTIYRAGDTLAGVGSGLTPMSTTAPEGLEHIQMLYEAGSELSGLSLGWPDLDKLTGGLQDGDLAILAARPAMGKSALAIGAMHYIGKNEGVAAAMFSLEMSKQQVNNRLLSLESGIPVSLLRSGQIPDDKWPDLTRATAVLSKLPLHIDDTPGSTVAQMRAKTRRLQGKLRARGERLGLVVVDYLQLMVGDGRRRTEESRNQEISEISRSLKVMARDLDVVVLALSQLSRAVEQRHDKRPMLSDLRDSGALEQDADIVAFIFREEYYNKKSDKRGEAEVIVGKNRSGPTGTANLAWIDKQARFANLARRPQVVSYE